MSLCEYAIQQEIKLLLSTVDFLGQCIEANLCCPYKQLMNNLNIAGTLQSTNADPFPQSH